jgi:hypothetical protein
MSRSLEDKGKLVCCAFFKITANGLTSLCHCTAVQPRPFVRFGRLMACFFSACHGTSAFAIFKVIDRDLHAIFKVKGRRSSKNTIGCNIFRRFFHVTNRWT